MKQQSIEQHFQVYSGWRQQLFDAVEDFRLWLKDEDIGDARIDQQLDQVLLTLRDDKLYVAFVAEFSRGKSELINAIFFADYGTRILPSSAGRTTMCPTELLYDQGSNPSLRLLPIDTRKNGTTITEYRSFTEEWDEISLDTKNPKSMIKALQHIIEVKTVSTEEARELGFHIVENENELDRKSTRLNSSHTDISRMPSSA